MKSQLIDFSSLSDRLNLAVGFNPRVRLLKYDASRRDACIADKELREMSQLPRRVRLIKGWTRHFKRRAATHFSFRIGTVG
jgi:hypothetical protein